MLSRAIRVLKEVIFLPWLGSEYEQNGAHVSDAQYLVHISEAPRKFETPFEKAR